MESIPYSPALGQQLTALFAGDRPVPIRLWAMLDGIIESRILVDRPETPACALVQELAEGTVYVGGAPAADALAEGIRQLRAKQGVVICLWPDESPGALPPAPDYDGVAIDFTNRSSAIDLARLAVTPAPYQLRRIDRDLAPLLSGFDYYVTMYGGMERALEATIGYCVIHGADIVSEAVAGPLARGIAEIGVGTHEQHRKRGLATAVSARVIQECEARGYRPFWNASYQNAPSITLARRLGFQAEQPFRVLAWSDS